MLRVGKNFPVFAFVLLLVAGLALPFAPSYAKDLPTPYFGVSYSGGANGSGFIFEVTKLQYQSSDMQILYSFCSLAYCADGGNPLGSVVQMPDGSLVGTTTTGGNNQIGTLFHLTLSASGAWNETVLMDFCMSWGDCAHYGYPMGTLSLIGPTTVLGTVSGGPHGHGLLYTFDLSANAMVTYGTW